MKPLKAVPDTAFGEDFTEEQEKEFPQQIIGLPVTYAGYRQEHGWTLEFDHRWRAQIQGTILWLKRKAQ